MKKKYLLFVAAGLAICSTSALNAQKKESTKANMKKKSKVEQPSTNNNPLLKKSKLQYQAPEFDKIKDKDFKPAFDYGLNEQIKQIEAIANNTDKPTFENTIVALENSGQNLRRAITIFSNLNSANTNPFLQALDEEYAPIFAAHTDKIFLNELLFQKIKRLYATRANLKLDAEDVRLIEYYNQQFEIAGANLNNEQKEELKKINEQLATLQSQFNNN